MIEVFTTLTMKEAFLAFLCLTMLVAFGLYIQTEWKKLKS
jgi:hypothetical protein